MDAKRRERVLVIVPCGRSKIWDKTPDAGPALAQDAYNGTPFKLNRQYAEGVGTKWIILSAKFGFIFPEFTIAGPYEVTFKRKSTMPVSIATLKQQICDLRLAEFQLVIGLGGKEYRAAVSQAFVGMNVELQFPFAGLPVGKSMKATKDAIGEFHSKRIATR